MDLIASLQLSTIFVLSRRSLALHSFTLIALAEYRETPITTTFCEAVLSRSLTNYGPRGVPFELQAPNIIVCNFGARRTPSTTPLRTFGKRASTTIPALQRQRGPNGRPGLVPRTWLHLHPTRTFVAVSEGKPHEWNVPKPLVPTPAAWPLCNRRPLKKTYILGITVALPGRPVVVTLTEATRPLPLLACNTLTGSRSLARTIGPSRPLSTKSSVEVAHVTALALRRTMNLLKPLQPHPTTPINPVYKVGLTLEELTGGPNRQEET